MNNKKIEPKSIFILVNSDQEKIEGFYSSIELAFADIERDETMDGSFIFEVVKCDIAEFPPEPEIELSDYNLNNFV